MTVTEQQAATPERRVVTILSPKGGAGKTSTATNLAVGLARRYPREVVIVDLDLQFGDVANSLNQLPKSTLADLARSWPVDPAQTKLALTPHSSGLYSLCAPLNPAEADDILAEHVAGALAILHASFRYVVVDTDPGLSERVLSALDTSTDIVLVCSMELPSVRGLRKALDALDTIGMNRARRHFLLNRSDTKVGLERTEVERIVGVPVDVSIPSSIDMVRATNDGIPVLESRSNPELTEAWEQIVDAIDGQEEAMAAGRQSRRLFKRKG